MSRMSFHGASVLVLLLLLTYVAACGGEPDDGAAGGEESASWAVVVGITDYRNFPPLEAGVERAERMRRMFSTTWNVPDDNMRVLLNGDATHDAVRNSLVEWLPERVSPGDEVLVFLSGYGSSIEDISGDEEDGLDQGFCTVDALEDSYANDILDDSLSYWMDQLPTERVTLIVEGDQFGMGDHDPDHPGHEEHVEQFPPMEAISVTRCGHRRVD